MAIQLQKAFDLIIRQYHVKPTDSVVVGVSTGVDSMVLLTLLEKLPVSCRPKIIVAHVNHKLREQSTEEQTFIEAYARKHNLQLRIKVWPLSQHPDTGIENAARKVRYDFFAEVAQNLQARFLFTAHQADDQAETFLMKLVRGGALQQLQGISSRDLTKTTKIVRPLLSFSKEEIRDFATSRHLKWYEDQTNTDESFTRNRMRHEIVPRLKQENPQFLKHVQSYESQLQTLILATRQYEEKIVKNLLIDEGYKVPELLLLSVEWQSLALEFISNKEVGKGLVSKKQQTEILQLLGNLKKPSGKIQINSQMWFVKAYDKFSFQLVSKIHKKTLITRNSMLILNQWHLIESFGQVAVFEADKYSGKVTDLQQTMQLSQNQFSMPLSVRPANRQDQLRLKTGGHKKVQRVLMDAKVSNWQRKGWPLLVDGNGKPIWLLGLRKSWLEKTFKVEESKYFIIWKPNNLEESN